MNSDKSQPQLPLAQVKGSWEDRIAHVARLLSKDDPTALAQSQALIDRLGRIPAAQRAAADHRLDRALIAALQNQARHLAAEEQYEGAASTLWDGARLFAGETAREMELAALTYLICSGATTAPLGALEILAAAGDIDEWAELVTAATQSGEYAVARRGLEQAERWVNQTHQAALDTPAAKRDQALLASMKARYAVAQDNFAEAVAWYEHAMALDDFFSKNPSYLYRSLVNKGAFTEAEVLLKAEDDPVLANFWRGLSEYRKGRFEPASKYWLKVTQGERPVNDARGTLESVLSHYYLGDESGKGLARVLELLNLTHDSWGAFYLAGLGWAMRDDIVTAKQDLRLAVKIYRADGGGRLLPNDAWLYCRDLLDDEKCELLKEFFDHATL